MSTSYFPVERSSLRYLLNTLKDEIKRELNCHAIGTIISFDSNSATASIAFNYKKVLKQASAVNATEVTDVIVDYPVLIRCPIIVSGGGGSYTTYPVFSGDNCLILFCDRDIDLWLEKGNINSAPNSQRMHDISDAVAIVGLNPVTNPIVWATDAVQTFFGNVLVRLTNLMAFITDVTGERLCQSGFLQPYAGSSAPSGWLLCYGQAVSRSTYSYLFSAVGTTYGTGDGLTTFNLPDLRGRTVAGLDNMGGSDANVLTSIYTPNRNVLGATVGEEAHQLTIPELPSHNHQYYNPNTANSTSGQQENQGGRDPFLDTTTSTGGNIPHNTVQPTLLINWIIKI